MFAPQTHPFVHTIRRARSCAIMFAYTLAYNIYMCVCVYTR